MFRYLCVIVLGEVAFNTLARGTIGTHAAEDMSPCNPYPFRVLTAAEAIRQHVAQVALARLSREQ